MTLLPSLALAVCLVEGAEKPQVRTRPVLASEKTRLTADGRFSIHYTLEGPDALLPATAGDTNPANGIPDTVDWAEAAAALMVDEFVGEDGWPAPVPDEGIGGDDRLDLYLRRLPEGANGFAYAELLPSGAIGGYLEVTPEATSPGKVPFQSVVGHEVFHILELAVGRTFVASWIAEASAAYAQYLVHTGDDRFLRFARELLWQIRLLGVGREIDDLDGTFEYAGLVWVKYLIDRGGGDRKLLLKLWQVMAAERNWVRGHEKALPAHFGIASLEEAIAEHAVWNWFACGHDDGRHYDPATNGCTLSLGVAASEAATPPSEGTSAEIAFRGSGYVAFAPDCTTADLSLSVTSNGRARFQAIAELAGGDSEVHSITVAPEESGTLSIPGWNRYRRVVLVGTNLFLTPSTFRWSSVTSGSYAPPTELPPPIAIAIAEAPPVLDEGDRAPVHATATYGNCEDGRDVTAEVEWRSSDERVAVVRAGVVEARGEGRAEITAAVGAVVSAGVSVLVRGEGGCNTSDRGSLPASLLVLLAVFGLRMSRCSPER